MFDRSAFRIRFDWGLAGVVEVANKCSMVVLVDVLSFCTYAEIATSRGAVVLPCADKDADAAAFARRMNARLAVGRSEVGLSLSPKSLLGIDRDIRLVLPSPNGATLALACLSPVVLAGCLRNAAAVAGYPTANAGHICVVAAGEQWSDGTPRFAFEDLVGAGAVIHHLPGTKSPEALAAEAAYLACSDRLDSLLAVCASGVELRTRGFEDDVEIAAALNVSECVPRLHEGGFVDGARRSGSIQLSQ